MKSLPRGDDLDLSGVMFRVQTQESQRLYGSERTEVRMPEPSIARKHRIEDPHLEGGSATPKRLNCFGRIPRIPAGISFDRCLRPRQIAMKEDVGQEDPAKYGADDRSDPGFRARPAGQLALSYLVALDDVLGDLGG